VFAFACGKDNIAAKDILGNLEDVPAFLRFYLFACDKDKISYEGMAFASLASLASLVKDTIQTKGYIHMHIPDLDVRVREFQQ
jgi:hypothetical protein